MPRSRATNEVILTPAGTQIERFLDVDACALRFSDARSHLSKVTTWGFFGFCALGLLAWESQRWITLISMFFWLIIAGVYFIPQAKKEVNRVMNHLIIRISFLEGSEKHLYVQRMDSVALGRREVAYQLGRDIF